MDTSRKEKGNREHYSGDAMKEHDRTRTRVNYSAHALIKSAERGTIGGTVRDIAIDTLYLYILPAFAIDERVNLEIILLGDDSQLTIKVPAIVIRKDPDGIALRFTKPLEWWPIFTFFPLHRLDDESQADAPL
jgi:PilZ domain